MVPAPPALRGARGLRSPSPGLRRPCGENLPRAAMLGSDGQPAEDAPASDRKQGPQSPTTMDRNSASSAFLTSIDAGGDARVPSRPATTPRQKSYPSLEKAGEEGQKILHYHTKLMDLANNLDTKMELLLKEHEKDFFLAYKTHMYDIQGKFKELKQKADDEDAKTREDVKIRALEGELDWFMREALRLDDLCKRYKKELDKWKAKAEALDEDRRFLEDQIKGAKRQNKVLRAAAERARSSAFSALMQTKARADELAGAAPATPALADRPPRASSAQGFDRPPQRALAGASATPEPQTEARRNSGSRAVAAVMEVRAAGGSQMLALEGPGTGGYPASPAGSRALELAVIGGDVEERYAEAIQHLKSSIVKEQQTVRMLKAARANTYTKKSELEEFFLKCIDDARKEFVRKQHLTINRPKNERQQIFEAMLSNEDVLVYLYEKIFPHRTGMARHLVDADRPFGFGGMAAVQDQPRDPIAQDMPAMQPVF